MNKQTKENSHLKTFRVATCTDMLSYVEPTLDRANLMELLFMWELMMYQGKSKRPCDFADSVMSVGKVSRHRSKECYDLQFGMKKKS